MKKAKIFVVIILFVSIVMLILDFPYPYTFNTTLPKIPYLSKNDAEPMNVSVPVVRPYRLGLDLQGGVSLTYDLDVSSIKGTEQAQALESSRNVIERRINIFGVSEPVIQTLKVGNNNRIVVELPGVTDVNQAVDLIGRTAQLTFWEGSDKKLTSEEATSSAYPIGAAYVFGGNVPVKTNLAGKDLSSASVGFNSQTGQTEVLLKFTAEGTKLFADITKRNLGKPVAIVLDDAVLQAPTVQSEILNGSASITGGFTAESAKNLSIALNAGALPVPLELVAQSNIGPSLGIESLKKSLVGGIFGLVSIIIFMIFLYKKEGVLACVALLIYTIIALFIFKMLPVTLTLAGIAGFILSIGMAVDANILIFERMKEERRAGRPQHIAVEQGFKRAWTSIRDSNITSIITSLILFFFGTGMVRGFALTLLVGILVSMFSAITVTRNLLRVFDNNLKLQKSNHKSKS